MDKIIVYIIKLVAIPKAQEHTFFNAASGNAGRPNNTDPFFAIKIRNTVRDLFFAAPWQIFKDYLS